MWVELEVWKATRAKICEISLLRVGVDGLGGATKLGTEVGRYQDLKHVLICYLVEHAVTNKAG